MKKKITEKIVPTTNVTGSISKIDVPLCPIWEPKTPNRFMVHLINDKTKKHVIEPYLIKYIDRPGYMSLYDKKVWTTIKLRIYESTFPGNILFRCLKAGVFDVQVQELGPVGDIIETWMLPHCTFKSVTPQPLNWSDYGNHQELQCELDWTEIIVKNGDSEFTIKK